MVEVSFEHLDIQDALVPGGPGLPLLTSSEGLSAEGRAVQARRAAGMLMHAEAILGDLSEEAIGDAIADDSLPPTTRDTLLSLPRLSSEVRGKVVARAHGFDVTETASEAAETSGESAAEKAARLSRGDMTPEERVRANAILDATYHRVGSTALAA